jgi:acetyl esterase
LFFDSSGGGFCIGSIESNEVYIRDWSNKTPNVPILSIGYSVSPEAKFPTALQEVMDTYLYLTSGDPAILLMLGFHPKRITLCGDSAGATLLTALTMALNDIRNFHKQNDQVDGQTCE